MTGRLAAITVLLGALIVIISQVVTAYALENELGEVLETVTLLSKHGVVTAILGLVAAIAVVFAVAAGNRSATIVVIGTGVAIQPKLGPSVVQPVLPSEPRAMAISNAVGAVLRHILLTLR